MGVLCEFFDTQSHWFLNEHVGLYFFYKRLKNQDIQRVDDRFHSAINLLGSSETSARTGAVYVLHELALEDRSQSYLFFCINKVKAI
jgi:hypothetical protein